MRFRIRILYVILLVAMCLQCEEAWVVSASKRTRNSWGPTSSAITPIRGRGTANHHIFDHIRTRIRISMNDLEDTDSEARRVVSSRQHIAASDHTASDQQTSKTEPLNNVNTEYIPINIERTLFHGKGCVLIARSSDFDHFLIQSAVFIYDHDVKRGSQGVILDKQSAFTLGEMSMLGGVALSSNPLFIGGSKGGNAAVMLHQHNLGGLCKYVGHGIYLGGIKEAQNKLEQFELHPKDFKFIFNNVEWLPGQLEKEITEGRWDVCVLPPKLVLGQSQQGLWSMAKNALQ